VPLPEIVAITVLAGLTFGTALLSLGLVGTQARLAKRVDDLTRMFNESVGEFGSLPTFNVVDIRGRSIDNAAIAAATTAILFVSPTCRSCRAALANLSGLYHKAKGGVVVVCEASDAECRSVSAEFNIETLISDASGSIMREFGVDTVPTALLVEDGRKIRSKGYPVAGDEAPTLATA
jgi:thioredoxin-like negative regulator of GroEL